MRFKLNKQLIIGLSVIATLAIVITIIAIRFAGDGGSSDG